MVLNFDRFSWTTASSKLYLSPTNLPLKIPACKGHSLVGAHYFEEEMSSSYVYSIGFTSPISQGGYLKLPDVSE
ncbi:hypothetical protein LOK49_LG13G00424 [Camellia lanceoleosa]|uniref:Uncharacterized protein n=1 Tax=Camellia lanceoleosa TaxID=1840588 RepID=A0ACC0FJB0_9ERIC|nr:hypothetical protein LOK49_LG13G00424 [Camellia lanceoleosa]